MIVGMTALTFSFGVFLLPISRTFGWGREVVSSALAVTMFVQAVSLLFVGQMVDRYSPKATVIIGTVLFGSMIAALSLITSSKAMLYVLFGSLGAVASTQTQVPYAKIVSAWFQRGRGTAIGMMLLGSAIGTTLMPPFAQAVIAAWGWRVAFLAIAAATLLVALPAQLLLLRWPPPRTDASKGQAQVSALDTGASLPSALRTPAFWGLAVALFLVANVLTGLMVHLFALLKDRSFSDASSVTAVSIAGMSMIAGRLIAGLTADRFRSDLVAAAFFGLPEVAIALLWHPTGVVGASVAAAVVGVCSGGETAIAAVLILKLFGQRAFGKIYAFVLFGFSIGAGTGPWLLAGAFDRFGTYSPGLGIFAVFSLTACMLALLLRPRGRSTSTNLKDKL